MQYTDIKKAIFIRRPNRFIANCLLDGVEVEAHVKNTGRCRELLLPGANVYLDYQVKKGRRTQYSLVSVEKNLLAGGFRLINMDSQAPNQVVDEALRSGLWHPFGLVWQNIKREAVFGSSRLDFFLENQEEKAFLEVKGVTLEQDDAVYFPDAPTQRGIKHLEELMAAAQAGYKAGIIFLIQMTDVKYFSPNRQTHPQFALALAKAAANGVEIWAYDCLVEADSLNWGKEVAVRLEESHLSTEKENADTFLC
ncbi:MAG: DNA/RNA nuclease SfsA [Clostridiales bacterium]